MSVTKKGFVVYFNNYPLMSALSFEQQGMLFSALMIYAEIGRASCRERVYVLV